MTSRPSGTGRNDRTPCGRRLATRSTLEKAGPVGLYAILAAAVLSPLLLRRGYPFALDMSFGPEMKIPPEAFGMGVEFGRRLPDFIWLSLLAEVVPPEVVVRILLLSIPAAAGTTAYFASKSIFGDVGLGSGGALYAGLLYVLNPFVYQRFAAGHWHILLGYAFFPLIVVACVRLCAARTAWNGASGRGREFWLVALASAVLGATSFAVAVMGLITLVLGILLLGEGVPGETAGRRFGKKAGLVGLATAVWIPGNATWMVPALLKSTKAGGFTDLDWRAFLVRGADRWEVLLNVLRLTGFYRDDLAPPSLARPSGFLASAGVVGLFVAGLAILYRCRRRLFAFSLVTSAVFLLLAMGERAPMAGPMLGWAYPRIPGWQMFRESQKLLVPVCFFYSAVGALAVSRLAAAGRPASSGVEYAQGSPPQGTKDRPSLKALEGLFALTAALLVPIALSPDLFFGLRGRITVSEYPAGWHEAAQALPAGDGKILVFPWHQHIPLGFTGGRTNVNPAADFFPKEVVQSTRTEFPGFILGVSDPIDEYVRDFISLGPVLTEAASALRPLGADSVLVLKTADWKAYGFLEGKPGLRKVVDNDDLRLYVVDSPVAEVSGFRPESESGRVQTGTQASSDDPRLIESRCGLGDGRLSRGLPFVYDVPDSGCWLVPEAYEAGWSSAGVAGPVWSGAAVGLSVAGPGRVVYRPAYLAIGGHLVTAATLVVAVLALVRPRRRRRVV